MFRIIGVLCATVLALATTPASALVYQEIGDAGTDFATAQVVTGGPYTGIAGDVGSVNNDVFDTHDVYLFGWGGGAFGMTVTCETCNSLELVVTASLFDANQSFLFNVLYGGTTPDFLGGISTPTNLGAGNYYLMFALGEVLNDPPVSMEIFTIDPGCTIGDCIVPGSIRTPMPEPASFGLLGLGLMGLAALRRRR